MYATISINKNTAGHADTLEGLGYPIIRNHPVVKKGVQVEVLAIQPKGFISGKTDDAIQLQSVEHAATLFKAWAARKMMISYGTRFVFPDGTKRFGILLCSRLASHKQLRQLCGFDPSALVAVKHG